MERRRMLTATTAAAAASVATGCTDTTEASPTSGAPTTGAPSTTSTTTSAATPARGPLEGDMRVTVLGSGSPLPEADRGGPCMLVEVASGSILVDCGRGALMRLAGAGGAAQTISAVLITHLHSDHITDLNDLITSRWALSLAPNPLRVFGPPGTQRVVDRTLAMLEHDIGYRLEHHADLNEPPDVQVTEVSDGAVELGIDGLAASCAPTEHEPVHPTVGYRFEAGGAVAAVVGDTIPCEGLDRLADGADIYVQTTVRRDQIEALGIPRMIEVLDYHSTIEQATATATRLGVGTLVLTHMVPAFEPGSAVESEWAALAAEGFGGEIVVSRDLSSVEA